MPRAKSIYLFAAEPQSGKYDELLRQILEEYRALESACDVVVSLGTGSSRSWPSGRKKNARSPSKPWQPSFEPG
jgi:hypothetical protein